MPEGEILKVRKSKWLLNVYPAAHPVKETAPVLMG
jgi:hypothetical protein